MDAIKVTDVKKKFKVYYDKGQTFKERLLFRNRNYHEDRWVLQGVSFTVKRGEAIGLVGENGSGKSTLLKLLTKIMYPDEGSIEIQGRVSSLIELGAGFHPDMSGRENIYTNAAIFGLTKKEIDERLNDIIAFSELEQFIDNPVRTYSSGMYMRLAFSVAINVNADVLLIDEILAVGDANFQSKCFDKLREIKAQGTTIVIVSHSLGQIEQICDRSLWLENGKIRVEGEPRYVHAEYMDFMGEKRQLAVQQAKQKEQPAAEKEPEQTVSDEEQKAMVNSPDRPMTGRWGNRRVQITNVSMRNKEGQEVHRFRSGDPITVEIDYKTKEQDLLGNIGISIFRNDEILCYTTNSKMAKNHYMPLKNEGKVVIELSNNNLVPGEYLLDTYIHSVDGFPFDDIKGVARFEVTGMKTAEGICNLNAQWQE